MIDTQTHIRRTTANTVARVNSRPYYFNLLDKMCIFSLKWWQYRKHGCIARFQNSVATAVWPFCPSQIPLLERKFHEKIPFHSSRNVKEICRSGFAVETGSQQWQNGNSNTDIRQRSCGNTPLLIFTDHDNVRMKWPLDETLAWLFSSTKSKSSA